MSRFAMFFRALFVLMLAAAAADAAESAPGVKLLRPDSFYGWDHAGSTRGWKIAEGRLTGTGGAAELLSGWTMGDFTLTLRFRTEGGGKLLVRLPQVPQGEGLTVELGPSADSGQWHTASLRRKCGVLEIEVDEKTQEKKNLDAQQRVGLALGVRGRSVEVEDVRLSEPAGKPLFNGKDLTGWWTPGKLSAWHAENGELVKRGGGGNYLRTEKEYGNFTLSFSYRISKGGNSGVGIRTPRNGWPSGDGMELQLLDRPTADKGSNMSIYRNFAPVDWAHKSQQWNDAVIKADGDMISAWVNGELVQHANIRQHPELRYRHPKGWIGFQDHGGVDRFRDIHILEAPSGEGLNAWYRRQGLRGAERVLNRLMNPQSLARRDGIGSQVAVLQTSSGEAASRITLKGPGALVRIDGEGADPQVALTFDGQAKPAVSASLKQLHGRLPRLTGDKLPLLTYAAFARSLKIELQGDKPTTVRLAYVSLPPELDVVSFTDAGQTIPAGWLESIDYRHSHHRFGQHRQNDPAPRAESEKVTLKPGESAELVSIPGGGVVLWFKLLGGDTLFQNDDLWIDVRADGAKQPHLSAPARYLAAAIADGQNYHNFVMLKRGGRFCRLAMPFAKGLVISARNTGAQPLSGVGATAAYLRAESPQAGSVAEQMRLRGTFSQDGRRPLELIGPGRVVGLVVEDKPGADFSVATLQVDRTEQPGWCGPSLNTLIGNAGAQSDFRACLSGRRGGLVWRYFWLAPIDFQKSLTLALEGNRPAGRLVLYYGSP